MSLRNSIRDYFLEGILKSFMERKANLRSRIAWTFLQREVDKMEDKKVWWKSKTLAINALTVLAGGLSFLASPDAKLDAQTAGTVASILGLVNMALRFFTNQSITK